MNIITTAFEYIDAIMTWMLVVVIVLLAYSLLIGSECRKVVEDKEDDQCP
jgi:heme/copper-type cytochrome/quinol oxidase subunit 1